MTADYRQIVLYCKNKPKVELQMILKCHLDLWQRDHLLLLPFISWVTTIGCEDNCIERSNSEQTLIYNSLDGLQEIAVLMVSRVMKVRSMCFKWETPGLNEEHVA